MEHCLQSQVRMSESRHRSRCASSSAAESFPGSFSAIVQVRKLTPLVNAFTSSPCKAVPVSMTQLRAEYDAAIRNTWYEHNVGGQVRARFADRRALCGVFSGRAPWKTSIAFWISRYKNAGWARELDLRSRMQYPRIGEAPSGPLAQWVHSPERGRR